MDTMTSPHVTMLRVTRSAAGPNGQRIRLQLVTCGLVIVSMLRHLPPTPPHKGSEFKHGLENSLFDFNELFRLSQEP